MKPKLKTYQCNECGLYKESTFFGNSEGKRKYKRCAQCQTILDGESPW